MAAPLLARPMLGVHMGVGSDSDLLALGQNIPLLAMEGVDTVVVEVDYNYQFKSRREMYDPSGISFAGARQFAGLCRQSGVQVIPEIDCLGHQSWASWTAQLLTRHPELDETPGRYPNNEGIYCRSWCPLHPELNGIVFPLIDELIDAFQASAFHCGMDEVFIIGSDYCPRCHGKDHAWLFAHQVNALDQHLESKHVKMLMWSDRLLNGYATGYGEWEASENGTDPAINMIPKDILLCDWHYAYRSSYPSLNTFTNAGFSVWPSTWNDPTAAGAFSYDAWAMHDPLVVGALSTTWGEVSASQLPTWQPFLATIAPWVQ